MISFFAFLFFLYFFLQSILTILFYLYLWQIKEYRADRLLCHLRTKAAKKQIVDYLNILKWKGALRPVFTLKATLIFFLSLILSFESWFFFLKYLPFDFSIRISLASFLVNILAPAVVSLVVFLFQPITVLLKKAIIFLAKRKISLFPNLVVVGVTGSFGKSSTKEFLATILGEKFKVLKTPKNWNTEIGVAKTILRSLNDAHQIFVVEMAAYKKGEIKGICQIVKPKIGIITGINAQHLGLFKSLENTARTKYELIESLAKDGLAIFNGDNPYCLKLAKKTKIKKKIYSFKEAGKIKIGKKKVLFEIDNQSFQLNLLGQFNLSNFLAAFFVAKHLGMNHSGIVRGAEKIESLEGTMKSFIGLNGAFFIDDTYSSNPDGFMAALSYLEKQKKKKIIVTPGMIELGRAATKIHSQIGRKMAAVCDLIILTKNDFIEVIKKSGGNIIVPDVLVPYMGGRKIITGNNK